MTIDDKTSSGASALASAGRFTITLDYSGSAAYSSAINAAVQKWQQVIVGDLPPVASSSWGPIDDIKICIKIAPIDGAGHIIGYGGYDGLRAGAKGLPFHGQIVLDSADMAKYSANGLLKSVVIHEIGHVLGFGGLWASRGLTNGSYGYRGGYALAEYRRLSGKATAASVPLENTGGSGKANLHWRESVFKNEVMTAWIESGRVNPLSRMTVASMRDLGYVVDMSKADAYSLPKAAKSVASSVSAPGVGVAALSAKPGDLWVNGLGPAALSLSGLEVLKAVGGSEGRSRGGFRERHGLLAQA
jgi:hypothetical protein